MLFYSRLGAAGDAGDRAELFTRLLKGNFLWKATDGGTFALAEDDSIVFAERLPIAADLDCPSFQDRLTRFGRAAGCWQKQLADGHTEQTATPQDTSAPTDFGRELPNFAFRV